MVVDRTFFAKLKEHGKKYASGIILPDGSYELTKTRHLDMLLEQMPLPRERSGSRFRSRIRRCSG